MPVRSKPKSKVKDEVKAKPLDNDKDKQLDQDKAKDAVKAKQPDGVKAKQPDGVKAKQPDGVKAKQSDVVKAKQPDVVKVKQLDGVKAKQSDVVKAKQSDGVKVKQLDVVKAKQPDGLKFKQLDKARAKELDEASNRSRARTTIDVVLSMPAYEFWEFAFASFEATARLACHAFRDLLYDQIGNAAPMFLTISNFYFMTKGEPHVFYYEFTSFSGMINYFTWPIYGQPVYEKTSTNTALSFFSSPPSSSSCDPDHLVNVFSKVKCLTFSELPEDVKQDDKVQHKIDGMLQKRDEQTKKEKEEEEKEQENEKENEKEKETRQKEFVPLKEFAVVLYFKNSDALDFFFQPFFVVKKYDECKCPRPSVDDILFSLAQSRTYRREGNEAAPNKEYDWAENHLKKKNIPFDEQSFDQRRRPWYYKQEEEIETCQALAKLRNQYTVLDKKEPEMDEKSQMEKQLKSIHLSEATCKAIQAITLSSMASNTSFALIESFQDPDTGASIQIMGPAQSQMDQVD